MINKCLPLVYIPISFCLVMNLIGCKSSDNTTSDTGRKTGAIMFNSATVSVVDYDGGTKRIQYRSTNPNNVSVTRSDNGTSWVSYVVKNSDNVKVWPPMGGALIQYTDITFQPNESKTYEFSWDGTCMPEFKKVAGVYFIEINDIFYGSATCQNVSMLPAVSN